MKGTRRKGPTNTKRRGARLFYAPNGLKLFRRCLHASGRGVWDLVGLDFKSNCSRSIQRLGAGGLAKGLEF